MPRLLDSSLTSGSLFTGVAGFDEGFRRAGIKTLWQVEKEPFCIAVLKSKFPNVERYYDVLKCGHDRTHKLRAVDVLTAGFPCQDLSVAGKRAGLAGARSGLFWEVVRILGELRPAWFVLENVPGLFSSNEGRDFAVILNSLDELGYGVAWRVLNSQFFGVAQRRRRVFIVGRFGEPCPAEVLFESEGGGGDFAESGEARAELASEIAASLRGGGADDPRGFRLDDETGLCAFTLPSVHRGVGNGHNTNYIPGIVPQAISSKWAKGSSGPAGDEHHNLTVVNCLAPVGGGADDNDAQAGHIISVRTAQTGANGIGVLDDGTTHTLDGTGADAVCAPSDSHGMRDFAELPKGLDSARYRALGNAVTVSVAFWIGKRIVEFERGELAR